jgi:hypothetical protein
MDSKIRCTLSAWSAVIETKSSRLVIACSILRGATSVDSSPSAWSLAEKNRYVSKIWSFPPVCVPLTSASKEGRSVCVGSSLR